MLIYSIILLLLSNAVNKRRDCTTLYSKTSTIILIYTSILIYFNLYNNLFTNGISLFGGLLYLKYITLVFILFAIIITMVILILISFFPVTNKKKEYTETFEDYRVYNTGGNYNIVEEIFNITKYIKSWLVDLVNTFFNKDSKTKILDIYIGEQQKLSEYPLIILFCLIGAIFLMLSSDIISVFLSIELQSYALYILCSIYRNSENSVNAGLTYFLLGGLSSCIILLGQSLLYLNTGNTSLENIYIIKNIYDTLYYNDIIVIDNNAFWSSIQYSLIIMSIGFLFKISSAPFHFWSPDVYDAIPTIVTTFVAIIAKISILIFLLEIVYYTSSNLTQMTWINNLLISCILSLIIGSILGLVQHRIKRLFAYSTISHLGFLLLALSINSYESIQAFLFYLIQYSISNLNAFMILIAIGYTLYNYVWYDKTISNTSINDINNSPVQLIAQLKGYFWINPILSISLVITLFSFVGVPPLVGFFGKQMILTSALNSGFVFITLIAILTSVISAVYYLFIIKTIFSEEKVYKLVDDRNEFEEVDLIEAFDNSLDRNESEKAYLRRVYNNSGDISKNTLSSSICLPISIVTMFLTLYILDSDVLNIVQFLINN